VKHADRQLHAFLAACGLRFEGVPYPFKKPGWVRPKPPEPTEAERVELAAQHVELERQLWERPWPVVLPEPTVDERWAELVERHEHQSPATNAAVLLRLRRDLVRYGVRRLRAGTEAWHQRPLELVRAESVAALGALGHGRFARWLTAPVRARRSRAAAVQMELAV
jgi:hypothetical protein